MAGNLNCINGVCKRIYGTSLNTGNDASMNVFSNLKAKFVKASIDTIIQIGTSTVYNRLTGKLSMITSTATRPRILTFIQLVHSARHHWYVGSRAMGGGGGKGKRRKKGKRGKRGGKKENARARNRTKSFPVPSLSY